MHQRIMRVIYYTKLTFVATSNFQHREAAVPSPSAQTKKQDAETPAASPLFCFHDFDGEGAFQCCSI